MLLARREARAEPAEPRRDVERGERGVRSSPLPCVVGEPGRDRLDREAVALGAQAR